MYTYQMEAKQSNLPLYLGIATVGYILFKRSKIIEDQDKEDEASKKKWVLLALLGALTYSFKDRLGEVLSHLGPLLASHFLLNNGMGYLAASLGAVFVYVGSNTGSITG